MVWVKAVCDKARKIKDSKEATAEIFKDVRKERKMASGPVSESISSRTRMISKSKQIAQVHILILVLN